MPSEAAVSESKLSRDRDAYARLRALGEQPRAITGAAEIERTAGSSWEVENNFAFRNDKFSKDWQKASDSVEVSPLPAA